MSYISLYRKYRPHKFKDVVGQNVVVKILENSILNNKIGHAYIFSGPRGTGKTSIAKIFARAVNCLKTTDGDVCGECESCKSNIEEELDIVEIDAASNNGVDEIREITNNVKLMPSNLKYRIYIIDEVHMLSTSAFNALLKTLEEPPAHAIFILATTEVNKIPATVISRCQKFDFKKINDNDIVNRLKFILKEENKKLNDDIVNTIAKLSDGGLRDAINLLDQTLSLNKEDVSVNDIYNLIGDINQDNVFEILTAITSGDIKNVIKIIDEYYNNGINFIKVCEKLELLIKDILIYNNTENYFDKEYEDKLYDYAKIDTDLFLELSTQLFDLNYDLKKSNNQKIVAEIYLIKMTLLFTEKTHKKEEDKLEDKSIKDANNSQEKKEESKEITKDKELIQQETTTSEEDKIIIENRKININNCLYNANKQLKNKFIENYDSIREYVTNKKYNSIANLLLKSTPEVVGETNILFTFKNNFEVVLFDKNTNEIVKLLKMIYNNDYVVVAVTNEEWNDIKAEYIKNINAGKKYEYQELKKLPQKKKKNTELQESVESIFGEEFINED